MTKIAAQNGDMRTVMNCAWALAAGIVLIDCVWLPLAGFHAAPAPLLRDAAIFAALCGLLGIYALLRPDAMLGERPQRFSSSLRWPSSF